MTEQKTYKAIFFDLDGTLLPMDTTHFIKSFARKLAFFSIKNKQDARKVLSALSSGSKAMMMHDGEKTNEEVFWDYFSQSMGEPRNELMESLSAFYGEPFEKIGKHVKPNEFSRIAVETLHQKGYPTILSTMPMFPRNAVESRLRWAGLEPDMFNYITSYENSHFTKPHTTYYQEIMDKLSLNPEEILMVGNNTLEDGSITELGSDLYLITDHLINAAGGVNVDQYPHGSMKDFVAFCENLPQVQHS